MLPSHKKLVTVTVSFTIYLRRLYPHLTVLIKFFRSCFYSWQSFFLLFFYFINYFLCICSPLKIVSNLKYILYPMNELNFIHHLQRITNKGSTLTSLTIQSKEYLRVESIKSLLKYRISCRNHVTGLMDLDLSRKISRSILQGAKVLLTKINYCSLSVSVLNNNF